LPTTADDCRVRDSWSLPLPSGRRLELVAGRPKLVGVVNLTPDSFSDGGFFVDPDRAVEHALKLVEEGADLLDLGAESTRPGGGVYGAGAREVPIDVELARLLRPLERLRALADVPISIDTRKAAVARAALALGADLINDVSALGDPEMAEVLRAADCPVVLMHSRGELGSMQAEVRFTDVVEEVRTELDEVRRRACASGIREDVIILDPGIGFGKTAEQNLELLRRTDRLATLGAPLLVGASRKSFLGALTGASPSDRIPGSLAAVAAARPAAALLRVHDVAATRQFLTVLDAIGAPEEGAR